MGEWRKTMCDLCPTGCGLEVLVEDNRIIKTRGDQTNPRRPGYICRKGLNIQYHQHSQRLTYPLKKAGNGLVKISWDQALEEIAEKIKNIIEVNSPLSVAYAGEPGQYGGLLMGSLGSPNYYSSLAQEKGGDLFAAAVMLGNPAMGLAVLPDFDQTDMLLIAGWNGMTSRNVMAQASRYLQAFSKDPNKILVVIDPRTQKLPAWRKFIWQSDRVPMHS